MVANIKRLSFLVIILAILLIKISLASAVDCPRGLINDYEPGVCNLYIDRDGNHICDLSEEVVSSVPSVSLAVQPNVDKSSPAYPFIDLGLITIILYFATWFYSREKIIQPMLHKRIWNSILLITFLASGLTGLWLAMKINYGFSWNLPFNVLYIHVETGIVMALVSIFHFIERFWFYKNFFKK